MKELDGKFTFKKRQHNSHKYDYGNILVMGGNIGMTGAPLMSAYAAIRTGSGLATIAIEDQYIHYLNNIYPEIMVMPYKNQGELFDLFKKKDAIAFGPGLGRTGDYDLILEHMIEMQVPLIVDADGIFHLKKIKHKLKNTSNIVITPHNGEMALFLDINSEDVSKDPIVAIKNVTDQYGIMVVLKGSTTFIAHQEEVRQSSFGNPGMATAGSGDVLTGIITSLVGQGINIKEASELGVYIHSKAGALAAKKYGEYSMIATDIIKEIPQVLKRLIYE